jgi:hypothetical protein
MDHENLETDSEAEDAEVRQESTSASSSGKERGRLATAWKIRITGSRVSGVSWEARDILVKDVIVSNPIVKEAGIQREQGKKRAKIIHYQGVFILDKRVRFSTLEKWLAPHFPNVKWDNKQGYLNPTKSRNANEYVMKRPTRIAGPWFKGEEFEAIAAKNEAEKFKVNITLRYWQKKICDILDSPPSNRDIWLFWEPMGGTGKTTFAKWIEQNYQDVFPLEGKAHDMKNGVCNYVKNNDGRYPKIILMNLPMSLDVTYFSANGVETIKDMFFFSGKFGDGKTNPVVNGPCPHFIIFANEDLTLKYKMAADRWRVRRLPDGKGVRKEIDFEDWSGGAYETKRRLAANKIRNLCKNWLWRKYDKEQKVQGPEPNPDTLNSYCNWKDELRELTPWKMF